MRPLHRLVLLQALVAVGGYAPSCATLPPSSSLTHLTPLPSTRRVADAFSSPSLASFSLSPELPTSYDVIADLETDALPRFTSLSSTTKRGPPNEWQLNQGKAIDSLRRDYPRLFTHEPDFSIFSEDIALYDPTGKRLSGMSQYKAVFQMLRFVQSTAMIKSEVTHRLIVMDDVIRVRWCAKLWMKGLSYGAEPALIHLDGVSAYHLTSKGKIMKHQLEDIVLTGREQQAMDFNLYWLAAPMPVHAQPYFRPVPAAGTYISVDVSSNVVTFTSMPHPLRQPSLPAPADRASSMEATETPMERAARERAEDEALEARRREQMRDIFEDEKARPFDFGLGLRAPQSCESNLDCDRPTVCCDLIFTSFCCHSGVLVGLAPTQETQLQRAAIPIPVDPDVNLM
ncbi:MAG: hypothetical protein SGPRY_012271 [Prymnesium sp.]